LPKTRFELSCLRFWARLDKANRQGAHTVESRSLRERPGYCFVKTALSVVAVVVVFANFISGNGTTRSAHKRVKPRMQPLAARQVARDKDMDAHHHYARPSVEALKLRRMRVQTEISLSTDKEDLAALHEELCRLNQQIEEAEH
jgi:hypothetical protein